VKVPQKTLSQFPSDLKVLDKVLLWFDQLNQPSIPKKVWLQCQLALAEAFTNAVRHAHRDCSSDVTIDIEVTLFPEFLEMRIWDHGTPFDLEQRLKNAEVVNQNVEGGRGLAILQQISDQLSYQRTADNRNCLLIVKRY